MTVRVAINGFGRIGRLVLRAWYELGLWPSVEVAAINDRGPLEKMEHLFRWDSVHGPFGGHSLASSGIRLSFREDPSDLDWFSSDIDVVLECTGKFSSRNKAECHLERGAKRVLIASPAEGADITVVYGVNHTQIKPEHKIISNASCTTGCLAPLVKVIQDHSVLKRGYMTTVHAMTGDQCIIDQGHRDLRRARAAGASMIPTSTGATRAIELIFPQLAGKLSGSSVRVPTHNVSLVDFVFETAADVTAEAINGWLSGAVQDMEGVLSVTDEPLVSSDFNHTRYSSIVDLRETCVVDGRMARILSWYDNEWAFANRMLDVASYMGRVN